MQYVYETEPADDSGGWEIYEIFKPYYIHIIDHTVCI